MLELEGLSHRGYTGGLMERRPAQDYQNYINGHSQSHRSQFVGEVLQVRDDGWAEVEAKNRFSVGDRLEIIHPSGNRVVQLEAMRNQEGETITVAQGSPIKIWVPLAAPSEGALIARLIA
jgi:putative protease